MTKIISTEILINASPEKVWTILSDFEKYPDWNPFIKSVKGKVLVGNKITIRLEPPGSNGMAFKPVILVFEKNKELRWIGHLLFPRLFDGEHRFELIDKGDGTITFRQSEKFNGILLPLFKKMFDKDTKNGFISMNLKLKQISEQQ